MKQYNNPINQIQRIKQRQRQITQQLEAERDEKKILKLLRETHNLTMHRLNISRGWEGLCR